MRRSSRFEGGEGAFRKKRPGIVALQPPPLYVYLIAISYPCRWFSFFLPSLLKGPRQFLVLYYLILQRILQPPMTTSGMRLRRYSQELLTMQAHFFVLEIARLMEEEEVYYTDTVPYTSLYSFSLA
jgi:hypothetical protein